MVRWYLPSCEIPVPHPAPPNLPPHRHPRVARAEAQALRLFPDPDGFLQAALVKLELIFERNPALREALQDQERLLEDLENLDFAPPPAFRPPWPRRREADAAKGQEVELTAEDLGRTPEPRSFTPRSTGAWRYQPGPACLGGPPRRAAGSLD